MATANAITGDSFASNLRQIYDQAMCGDLHEALRCINGIADAIHPVFGELDSNQQDSLIVGISPLVNITQKELNEIFEAIETLILRMETAEVSHA